VISKKPILNKFYKYADTIVKLKKISKINNKIYAERLDDGEMILIPYEQSDLLLIRLYTVGEVSKIVERRADTLRKYEKKNLIPIPNKFGDKYKSYQNWRYYEESDVYEMIEFFNDRIPGRPVRKNKKDINTSIKTIEEKVKLRLL
jgi:hypothetical protein